jgi:[ribosomal protein S5]-alanine N-acetyltransferase
VAIQIRLITVDDAVPLTQLLIRNREFLAPWTPLRADDYFLPDSQARLIAQGLESYRRGDRAPYVILAGDRDEIVGRVTLSSIVRGAFESASLSYWVAGEHNGRGIATAAVAAMVEVAFSRLNLHRLQAETLLRNLPSQRVLETNGFTRYGEAADYLRIAGKWQDHALYQLLNRDVK